MTGSYPQFMQTSDGRAILGRAPTLTDTLTTVNQGAPLGTTPGGTTPGGTTPGGTAGPILGRGDLGLGTPTFPTRVPGQGVPTGATNLGALLHLLLGTGGGGGGTGGAAGAAPGGISPGASAAESGNRFAQANAAVTPSLRNAMQMAGLVMSPMTAPQQLLGAALAQMMGFGSGFTIGGGQLTPQQLQAVSQAYQQYGPAYAQRLLASMRDQAIAASIRGGGQVVGPGATPMGGFGTISTPQGPMLSANFTSPGFGLTPGASTLPGMNAWGGGAASGGPMGGGGGDMGGGGPDTGGGLGGGPGNMGGGANRSM